MDQDFETVSGTLQYFQSVISHSAKALDPVQAPLLRYFANAQSYRFVATDNRIDSNVDQTRDFTPADVASNAVRFTTYRNSSFSGFSMAYELIRLNAAATNDLVALTHASFGAFSYERSDKLGNTSVDYRPFGYAILTPAVQIPTTGSLTYKGPIIGRAAPVESDVNGAFAYELTGHFTVTFDFAARTLSGTMSITGKRRFSTETVDFGSFPLQQQTALASVGAFSASAGSGKARGLIAGPNASEITLSATFSKPNAVGVLTYQFTISGAGKR